MAELNMELPQPKIYAAIAGVIADCGSVGKDKVNKQQGFKYRSVDDVFNALHPALAKNKVVIVPTIVDRESSVAGKTKNGTDILKVVCKVKYDIYAEDGSKVTSIIYGEGLDMGDKATNKAMAIAYKYLCFQVFCIPTEDLTDPDSESLITEDEQKAPAAATANKRTAAKNTAKKETPAAQPQQNNRSAAQNQQESSEGGKITEAMVNTIRAEQARTGVKDAQILGVHGVQAKQIEDLTVPEFKIIMAKFERTAALTRKEEQSE